MPDDPTFYGTSGPRNAKIMAVGESWGWTENIEKQPFVGSSGHDLTGIFSEAKIDRREVFMSNVFAAQPLNDEAWRFFEPKKGHKLEPLWGLHPNEWARSEIKRLYQQIEEVRPELIIAIGNYALWALTEDKAGISMMKEKATGKSSGVLGPTGIMKWRGSMLLGRKSHKVLPIIHPAAIQRQWSLRAVTVHDLKARVPMAMRNDWINPRPGRKLAPPTYEQVLSYLDNVQSGMMVADVETLPKQGLLVCIGLCQSLKLAISIPFITVSPDGTQFGSYWNVFQEAQIIKRLRRVFARPDIIFVGQNFTYDQQWIVRDIGVLPRLGFDTMLGHHVLWPGTTKTLDHLSSLYRPYHVYWKDESNEWNFRENGLEIELSYNCEDLFATFEIATELIPLIKEMGFERQHAEILEENQELALDMMRRGVLIDEPLRSKMGVSIALQISELETWLDSIFPDKIFGNPKSDSPWWGSPQQTAAFLYDMMGLHEVRDRKTKSRSTGKEALEELTDRYPRLRRLFAVIKALRSLEVFQSHFIRAPLDSDGRMRCSFNTGGPETFRWSSSANPFGRGTNLQNIPTGNEDAT